MNKYRPNKSRLAVLVAGTALAIVGCTSSHGAATPTASAALSSVPASTAASSGTASSAAPRSSVASLPPASVPASSSQLEPGSTATSEASAGGPTLTLSASHGAAGSIILLSVNGCLQPAGGYTGFFADAHALATPDDSTLRRTISPAGASGNIATATYIVGAKDAVGSGLFEIQCAGNANATAAFTVDR
jgi:hypothetical protein